MWGLIHKHLTVVLQNSQPLPHQNQNTSSNRTEVDNITWKLVSFLSPSAVYFLLVNLLLSSTVELVLGVSFGDISGSKLQVAGQGFTKGKRTLWHSGGLPEGLRCLNMAEHHLQTLVRLDNYIFKWANWFYVHTILHLDSQIYHEICLFGRQIHQHFIAPALQGPRHFREASNRHRA